MGQQHIEDARWYALRVVPQKEYVVARILERREVWAYVPTGTYFRRRTRYDKMDTEYARPELPGCIFARFPSSPQWFNVLRNHLILGPIGRNGAPWVFDPGELHRYFARVPNGTLMLEPGEPPQVSVRGRLLRAPTTQVRTISKRARGEVVEPTAREIATIGAMATSRETLLAAA